MTASSVNHQSVSFSRETAPFRGVPFDASGLPPFEEVAGSIRAVLEAHAPADVGAYTRELEAAASAYLGTDVVAVASASLGLLFTLQALGLKAGQRVVVPSLTGVSTVQAIRYAGGVPLFAEVGPDLTLAPDDLEALLSRRDDIAAVVPTHCFGQPCDVDAIQQVVDAAARRLGRPISLVYDGSQAFGASSNGQLLGRFGSAEVFSLPAVDMLRGVRGGLIACRHVGLRQRIRTMRNCGMDAGARIYWPGIDGHLSDLHATIGLANLRTLPARMAERRRLAHVFGAWIERATAFRMAARSLTAPTYHRLVVVGPPHIEQHRDQLVRFLNERGIDARSGCCQPTHLEPHFRSSADRRLPLTEQLARRTIALPFFTSISADEMAYVVAALADAERAVDRLERPSHAPAGGA